MNPVQATGSVDMPDGQTPSSSYSETFRISGYVNRLLAMIGSGERHDTKEISDLCVSLSRCIGYALSNNEIPNKASELPFLLRQLCQWTGNDRNLQTAIMVLIVSLKGACENGWFTKKDSEEVYTLWSEMKTSICSAGYRNSPESIGHHNISDTRSHVTNSQGQTVISGSNDMRLPTHAIGASNTFMNPILQSQSETHDISASSMQFQQHSMNSMSSNYGPSYTTPNRHVTTTSILNAIQIYRDQFMSMVAASMPENIDSQNWVHDLSNVSTQPAQQFGAYLGSSYQPSGHHFNSYRQSVNHMIPNSMQPSIGQANQQAHRYVGTAPGSISNQQTYDDYANATAPQAFHTSGWTTPGKGRE